MGFNSAFEGLIITVPPMFQCLLRHLDGELSFVYAHNYCHTVRLHKLATFIQLFKKPRLFRQT